MSAEQTNPEIEWVPLAEAPLKLRFGWELPKEKEWNGPLRIFKYGMGWVSIYRTSQGYFVIKCYQFDDHNAGAAFPIGDNTYLGTDALGTDAHRSVLEITEQRGLVNA